MNAEDIIQLKEWQELTEAEKESIATLAASEGEYNILKKLLLIAKEDAGDVPAIDPGVRVNLHAHLQKARPKKTPVLWWVAAAAVVGIILTVLFVKTSDHPGNPGLTPGKDFIVHKDEQSIDSSSRPSVSKAPEVSSVDKEDTIAVSTDSKQQSHPRKTPDSEPSSIAQVSVAVSNNRDLLEFVTEVY